MNTISEDFVIGSERHLHHPWCNYYWRPRKDCNMCERFFKNYPLENEAIDIHKYFPEVIIKNN